MIHLENIIVKEAGRVWGDYIEKKALEVDVNPANVLGSLAGGYAATRTYQTMSDRNDKKNFAKKRIENNHYDNIQNILSDLKIVFTPINVIYSVNGQSFEIIKTNEMSPEMKSRFLQRDSEYFKNILIQKMNMELQLAEQVFARRLLAPHLPEGFKEANFVSMWFEKLSEEKFKASEQDMLEKTANLNYIPLEVSFDSLRPFGNSEIFFDPKHFEKVANPIDYFRSGVSDNYTQKDLKNQVKIGFLPDRVIYLLNGQMIEQLSVMNMNEEGYAAFQKKDREFFLNFFSNEADKISNAVVDEVIQNQIQKSAEENDEEIEEAIEETEDDDDEDDNDDEDEDDSEKQAATLEEVIGNPELTWEDNFSTDRNIMDLFEDHDIHPIIYDNLLDGKFGDKWHELELEAILKEIELEFNLTEPIGDRALDKIAMLHTIQNEDHSLFATAFTFEKFVRAMNNKSVIISEFEGGLELEEILFAIDIADAITPHSVYAEFGTTIAPYVSEELMQDGVRYVSNQLYDESDSIQLAFWKDVNGFLRRKWLEKDTFGLEDDAYIEAYNRTDFIIDTTEKVLTKFAEFIDIRNPYESARSFVQSRRFLDTLSVDNEIKTGIENAITQCVGRHFIALIFLNVKRQEAVDTYERIAKESNQ